MTMMNDTVSYSSPLFAVGFRWTIMTMKVTLVFAVGLYIVFLLLLICCTNILCCLFPSPVCPCVFWLLLLTVDGGGSDGDGDVVEWVPQKFHKYVHIENTMLYGYNKMLCAKVVLVRREQQKYFAFVLMTCVWILFACSWTPKKMLKFHIEFPRPKFSHSVHA